MCLASRPLFSTFPTLPRDALSKRKSHKALLVVTRNRSQLGDFCLNYENLHKSSCSKR